MTAQVDWDAWARAVADAEFERTITTRDFHHTEWPAYVKHWDVERLGRGRWYWWVRHPRTRRILAQGVTLTRSYGYRRAHAAYDRLVLNVWPWWWRATTCAAGWVRAAWAVVTR